MLQCKDLCLATHLRRRRRAWLVCHHPIVTLLSDQVGGTKFPPEVIKKSSLFLSSVLNTVSADSDGLRTLQGVANLPLMNEAYVVASSEATVVE